MDLLIEVLVDDTKLDIVTLELSFWCPIICPTFAIKCNGTKREYLFELQSIGLLHVENVWLQTVLGECVTCSMLRNDDAGPENMVEAARHRPAV
jgi:hypothetical protein